MERHFLKTAVCATPASAGPTCRSRQWRVRLAGLAAAVSLTGLGSGCATVTAGSTEAAVSPPVTLAAFAPPSSSVSAAVPAAAPLSAPAASASEHGTIPATPRVAAEPTAETDAAAETGPIPVETQDLWARIRAGLAIPDLHDDWVEQRERYYSERPDYVARMVARGSRYLFHIVEEVERRKLPTELALLPFIESAFNPQAMSTAKASGMWQFIPSTGRDFDLKQNLFRDDRRSVVAATEAALDYLEKLYRLFGDWHLALAAYNWGQGNVQRAIDRNRRAGLDTDYLSLRMPRETRDYVPKLQAIENILMRPKDFGIALAPLPNEAFFTAVRIERDIDVDLAARLAGLSLDEFKALNPQMNKPVILAAGTPEILLPHDNARRFTESLALHTGPVASWTAWTAPTTLRPAEAARRVGMSEEQLREVNRIPPRMLVRAGSTLLVTRAAHKESDVPEHVADNAVIVLAPDGAQRRRQQVTARAGDTLATIARRHRVSVDELASWNRMAPQAAVRTGQRLVVFTSAPARAAPATRTASARQAQGRASSRPERAAATRKGSSPARKPVAQAAAERRSASTPGTRVAQAPAR
jgi:membrane-bound lytic murein transglycosylase D